MLIYFLTISGCKRKHLFSLRGNTNIAHSLLPKFKVQIVNSSDCILPNGFPDEIEDKGGMIHVVTVSDDSEEMDDSEELKRGPNTTEELGILAVSSEAEVSSEPEEVEEEEEDEEEEEEEDSETSSGSEEEVAGNF